MPARPGPQLEPEVMRAVALTARDPAVRVDDDLHFAALVEQTGPWPARHMARQHPETADGFIPRQPHPAMGHQLLRRLSLRAVNLHLLQRRLHRQDLSPAVDAAGQVVNQLAEQGEAVQAGGYQVRRRPGALPDLLGDIAAAFQESPTRTFEQVRQRTGAAPHLVAAGLNRFALLGQLIHDLAGGVYRWRSILPVEASMKQVKIDSPEAEAAKDLVARGRVKVTRDETVGGLRALAGKVENRDVEVVCDPDGKVTRGQCNCSHYFRFKLRAGPCRHMQAVRRAADGARPAGTLEQWYRMLIG